MTNLVKKLFYYSLAVIALETFCLPAWADSLNNVANEMIDAARIAKNVNQSPIKEKKAIAPNLILPAADTSKKLAKPKQEFKFSLNKVIIEGNSVYKIEELEPFYRSYLASFQSFYHTPTKSVGLSDLQDIAQAITFKYREAGYLLSQAIVPAQHVENGIVHIRIIEGFIDHVSIEGKITEGTRKTIENYAKELKAIRPLRTQTLERYALLINNLPGVKMKMILTPSKTVASAADLIIQNEPQKLSETMINYNNFGTRYTGPQQTSVSEQLNGALGSADIVGLRAADTLSSNALHYMQAFYKRPIGKTGLSLDISTDYAETRPSFTLEPLRLKGFSQSTTTQLTYPILKSRLNNLSIYMGARWLDTETDRLATGTDPIFLDHTRTLQLGVDYDAVDTWKGINTASAEITKGLPVFGASPSNPYVPLSRGGATSNFTKFNLTTSREQYLIERFSALLELRGQYSRDSLLSSEEFGFGGPTIGRGYDPSEITGDSALAGKFEIRMNAHPNQRFLQMMQYYTFYDAGMVWNIDRSESDQLGRVSATSTGAGIRILFCKYLIGQLEMDKPLTYPVQVQKNLNHDANDWRAFFNLSANL